MGLSIQISKSFLSIRERTNHKNRKKEGHRLLYEILTPRTPAKPSKAKGRRKLAKQVQKVGDPLQTKSFILRRAFLVVVLEEDLKLCVSGEV